MEIRSQKPRTVATRKPSSPISGMSCHKGGIFAWTRKDEPRVMELRIMAMVIRLVICSCFLQKQKGMLQSIEIGRNDQLILWKKVHHIGK